MGAPEQDVKEVIEVYVSKLVYPLIPEFLAARRADAKTIEESTDFAILQRIGHNMKGNGAAFGFEQISTIGLDLEQAAIEKDQARAKAAGTNLTRYLEQIKVMPLSKG